METCLKCDELRAKYDEAKRMMFSQAKTLGEWHEKNKTLTEALRWIETRSEESNIYEYARAALEKVEGNK